MKTYILIIGCLLLVVPCQAAKKHARSSQQNYQRTINWRIQKQKNRLNGIDQLLTQEKQDIEEWYASRLDALQQDVEDYVLLKFWRVNWKTNKADLYIWTEFFKMLNQIPYAYGYFDFAYQKPFLLLKTGRFSRQRGDLLNYYFYKTFPEFLMDKKAYNLLSRILENDIEFLPDISLRRKAYEIFRIMEEFQFRAGQLKKDRDAKLAQLGQRPLALKEEVSRIIHDIRSQSDKPRFGMVSAISYEPGGTFALIEGIDSDLVSQGDMIGDIKIVKIDRYKVEFQKKRKTWTQKMGETPEPELWK